jgi:hypothetical protein
MEIRQQHPRERRMHRRDRLRVRQAGAAQGLEGGGLLRVERLAALRELALLQADGGGVASRYPSVPSGLRWKFKSRQARGMRRTVGHEFERYMRIAPP